MIKKVESIKSKLVILYIMLVFIVMILSGTIMLFRLQSNQIVDWETSLKEARKAIVYDVIETSEKTSEYNEKIAELYKQHGTIITSDMEIFILTPKGNFFGSSTKKYSKVVSDVIISAMSGEEKFKYGAQIAKSDDTKGKWMEYGFPVKNDDGEIDSIIYIRISADDLTKNIYLMATTILAALFIALAVAAAIGYLFANTLTNPILKLTSRAKELAKGNFQNEIPVNSTDEIGQLTQSFNYMAKQLRSTIATTQLEKNKLAILLHNMTDGVLAYDANKDLIHANAVSLELLEMNEEEIKTFNILGEKFDIDIDLISTKEENEKQEYTVQIGDKFISAIFTTYSNKSGVLEGIIIVLQDVTKHKKLDNMRKEFVANVSHEIRTPLTTIKGYTETLIDGEIYNVDTAMHFLQIIESETDKMTVLTQDLLELSHFDNKQFKIILSKVNLVSLIREVIVQNKLLANSKNQELILNIEEENINIIADRGRILQVMTNIISNAIKYSVEAGKVTISVDESEEYYCVKVKDSGMGIPEEDLPHIFERFYRVDKARSRAMGGTGLGLPIAKEIMELHGGKISVESKISKGSTFILYFNKKFGHDKEFLDNDTLV